MTLSKPVINVVKKEGLAPWLGECGLESHLMVQDKVSELKSKGSEFKFYSPNKRKVNIYAQARNNQLKCGDYQEKFSDARGLH